jgi:hypothetical protein
MAGDQAGRGWAKVEAIAFYEEAVVLVGDSDPALRRDILRRRAVASVAVVHMADVERLRPSGQAKTP